MATGKSKYQESFRDAISTVDEQGKRIWLHPTKPSGRHFNARAVVSVILLVFLFGAPFLKINGQPFLLFDVLDRKFVILGQLFVPQDFHIFVFGMLLFFVFIVLFTVVYGRIWCGWACPQTIFMEMLYRRIEYWIEGDAPAQRRLKKAPWNAEKIRKKGIKHALFILVSVLLANMFLAYFIGVERLQAMVTQSPVNNWGTFVAVGVTTGLIYFIYARFREQVCTTFCPYGRLQGVLLDENSIAVSYDYVRGEPRGKMKKNEEDANKGDCIDCGLCVRVCPTGIDIRNGTQLECINCTACIDACDSIMDKIEKPRGLVRYASEKEIETGKSSLVNARSMAYTGVLVILLGVMGFLLVSRTALETTILRAPGTMYQKTEAGMLRNLYTVQLVNKTVEPMEITLKLESHDGKLEMVGGNTLHLKPKEVTDGAFFLEIAPDYLKATKMDVYIGVYDKEGRLIEQVKTGFVGPIVLRKR